jgi:hypothetical protein
MRRRFYIEVSEPAFDRLSELAGEQHRSPRQQASVLLERALNTRRANTTDEHRGSPDVDRQLDKSGSLQPRAEVA